MKSILILTFGILSFTLSAQVPDAANKKQWEAFFESGVEQKLKAGDDDLEAIIETANGYLGTPHCMGGRTKDCIDCSGLVLNVLQGAGFAVDGRSAQDLARYGKLELNQSKLERGDLVFFTKTYRTGDLVTHAGIMLDEYTFIHTSASKGVMISSLEYPGYWQEHFIFGTKL